MAHVPPPRGAHSRNKFIGSSDAENRRRCILREGKHRQRVQINYPRGLTYMRNGAQHQPILSLAFLRYFSAPTCTRYIIHLRRRCLFKSTEANPTQIARQLFFPILSS